MICESCSSQHAGEYGSGRFCCVKCSRSFSTKNARSEINKKVSARLRGKPSPLKGRKSDRVLSKDERLARSESLKDWYKRVPKELRRRPSRKWTEDDKAKLRGPRKSISATSHEKMRLATIRRNVDRSRRSLQLGKTPVGNSYGVITYHDGIYYRSLVELFFAKKLIFHGIRFLYEPRVFKYLDTSSRTRYKVPDFYLPDLDIWIEVGLSGRNKSTIRLVSEQCGISIVSDTWLFKRDR